MANYKKDIALELINRGINVNVANQEKATALIRAILGKYNDLVKLLIERKADVNVKGSPWPPLHLAARNRDRYSEVVNQ